MYASSVSEREAWSTSCLSQEGRPALREEPSIEVCEIARFFRQRRSEALIQDCECASDLFSPPLNDVVRKFGEFAAALVLEGDDPVVRALRNQLAVAEVREREFTGVGFFTYLLVRPGTDTVSVPDGVVPVPLVGDVRVEAESLRHGAGFVLFLKDRLLHLLEGYTFGNEAWPDDLGRYVVRRDALPGSERFRDEERGSGSDRGAPPGRSATRDVSCSSLQEAAEALRRLPHAHLPARRGVAPRRSPKSVWCSDAIRPARGGHRLR